MEWEPIVLIIIGLFVACFILGFIDVTLEQRKRRREQAEREENQKKGDKANGESSRTRISSL